MILVLKRVLCSVTVIGLLFLLIIQSCNNFSQLTITEKRLNYKIVLPEYPTKAQRFAAEELRLFLRKIYTDNIVTNGYNSEIAFIIGDTVEAKKYGIKDFKGLKHDRFGVFRNHSVFLFLGNSFPDLDPASTQRRQAGTLSAVYYFLTKYLDVNFYYPGETGYKLPSNPPIIFEKKHDIPEPTFEVRATSLQYQGYSEKEAILFFRRSLGNLPYWARHDYYYYFLNKWRERFGESHPEYFGLYNGERISKNYPYHLPCFSNPAVIKQIVQDIDSVIKADPNILSIKLFADCPLQFCQCNTCKAMEERKYIGETEHNGEMVYGIVKKVMDEFHKKYPHIQFLTQTKKYTDSGNYYLPPKLIRLESSCTVEHLIERSLSFNDHKVEVEIAKQWKKQGVKMVLKSYERYPVFKNYPVIQPYSDQELFKQFAGIVSGTRYSGAKKTVPYSFCALGEYLQYKMLFDININLDDEIREFCAFAYPEADNEMVRFYKVMEDVFMRLKSRQNPMLSNVYSVDNLEVPMHILEEASQKVNPGSFYFKELYFDFKEFYIQAKNFKELNSKNKKE